MIHSDKMINLCRMLFLLLSSLSHSIYAQSTFSPASKTAQRQLTKTLPYYSTVTQRLEAIRKRTGSGYYVKFFKTEGSPNHAYGMALRIAETCDISCKPTSLPVTLISFRADRVNASQVLLKWETSSETNNMGFSIERSRKATADFEQTGFVDGHGNTNSSEKYVSTDHNSFEGVSYYRLKQLDFDGTFKYSRVVSAAGFWEELSVISVPNPGSQHSCFLQVKGNSSVSIIQLTVVDVNGKLLHKNVQYALGNDKRIPLSNLPELQSGLYIAKIVSGNQQSTVSFIIGDR